MRTGYPLIFVTLVLLAASACKKQSHYPSESTTGANVFGCYVDGNLFIPCAPYQWSIQSKVQAGKLSDLPLANVAVKNKCDRKYVYGRFFILHIDSVHLQENKTYQLGNFYKFQRGVLSMEYWEDLNYFFSDSSLPGTITIRKFDPQQKILSADFQAVVRTSDGSLTRSLTKGTFDVTFQ